MVRVNACRHNEATWHAFSPLLTAGQASSATRRFTSDASLIGQSRVGFAGGHAELPHLAVEVRTVQAEPLGRVAHVAPYRQDGRFDVRSVNNGFGAGMQIKEFRPDLAVLDVMLPDINGKEVCQLVRGDKSMDDVRIICISGMVETDKIQELHDAGANDFMKKPFDVDHLVGHICQLLEIDTISAK